MERMRRVGAWSVMDGERLSILPALSLSLLPHNSLWKDSTYLVRRTTLTAA